MKGFTQITLIARIYAKEEGNHGKPQKDTEGVVHADGADIKKEGLGTTEGTERHGRVRTKIVYISKCMDCPVRECENRHQGGGIPEECELDDATPIKVSYRCRRCGRQFVLINAQHAYCPYCGAGDPQLY